MAYANAKILAARRLSVLIISGDFLVRNIFSFHFFMTYSCISSILECLTVEWDGKYGTETNKCIPQIEMKSGTPLNLRFFHDI